MSDEPKRRSRAWTGWTLTLVFVVYPLSVIPVDFALHWSFAHGYGNYTEAIRPIYVPLLWALGRVGIHPS